MQWAKSDFLLSVCCQLRRNFWKHWILIKFVNDLAAAKAHRKEPSHILLLCILKFRWWKSIVKMLRFCYISFYPGGLETPYLARENLPTTNNSWATYGRELKFLQGTSLVWVNEKNGKVNLQRYLWSYDVIIM